MSESQNPLRGYLYIAVATFFWGLSAAMGRAAFTGRLLIRGNAIGSIDPVTLSQSRTTLSFLLLLPVLLLRRGWRGIRVSPTDGRQMALLGIFGLAASNYFYYLSIQRTNVAIAITVQYTAPVWVLLYMVAKKFQRPTIRRIAAVGISMLGIVVAIGSFRSIHGHLDTLGLLAALLAAFAYAFYNIGGHRVMRTLDHWTVILYVMFAAAIFWMFLNPPWKIVAQHFSGAQWIFLTTFALTSMLIPFSFYFAGLKLLEPTRAVITSCLEPVFAILIAAVTLGETIRLAQAAGMLMVLAAIVLTQF